ncbi:MAG: hypothetical protein RLZZ480_886, partial [Candidatus Parcubacteria bacterium]
MHALWRELGKKEQIRLLWLVGMLAILLLSWLPAVNTVGWFQKDCNCLVVSFLDVGQGDAVLIETPDGFEMLVDGGRDSSVLRELGKERSWFDREIDMVVATHPDLDHIAGLVDVLKRYKVNTILMTTNEGE